MNTRLCKKCEQIKDVSEFYSHKKNICKECVGKYVHQWQRDNKEHYNKWKRKYYARNKEKHLRWSWKHRIKKIEWLMQYKKTHPCVMCGEADYRCLEFHHIDGRGKDLPIPTMVNYVIEKIEQEIRDKCQVLCANCHRKVHYSCSIGYVQSLDISIKGMIGQSNLGHQYLPD